jgi:filamentous hemagglutinin family protein
MTGNHAAKISGSSRAAGGAERSTSRSPLAVKLDPVASSAHWITLRARPLCFGATVFLVGLMAPTGARALNVLSDSSMTNPTIVTATPAGEFLKYSISGGTQRGDFLFHSFSVFQLVANELARFAAPPTVRSIFARVTGISPSVVDGLIGVDHTADLYFMDQSGIIFGPNAVLNVGGDFVATTAIALNFQGQPFGTTPILDAPIAPGFALPDLLFGSEPQSILNNGNLVVQEGKRLILADRILNPPNPHPPSGTASVPGPLPWLGAAVAFRTSRRIRHRVAKQQDC